MRPDSSRQTPPTAPRSQERGSVKREMTSITCQLDVRSDWSYELFVVPHRDPAAAVIERFDAPTPARLRQAEVAQQLRANGWTVVEYGAALSIHRAA